MSATAFQRRRRELAAEQEAQTKAKPVKQKTKAEGNNREQNGSKGGE